jgi:hypothetical protein
LINKCRPPIASEILNEEQTALKIIELSQKNNPLKTIVSKISNRLDKTKIVDLNDLFFPRLSEDNIKSLTFGIYQLKQVKRSLVKEHLLHTNSF